MKSCKAFLQQLKMFQKVAMIPKQVNVRLQGQASDIRVGQ